MAKRKKKKSEGIPLLLKIVLFPVTILVIVLLPFLIMIRLSVHLYEWFGLNGWLALGIGVMISMVPVYYYIRWLANKLRGRKKEKAIHRRRNLQIAVALVSAYTTFTLFYISGVNAKTEKIRSEYTSLHPLLRVGVSTLLIFDRSMVVTDLARTHADYDAMDLARKKNSLHYAQSDGFVHAVDIRTLGRAEWRNALTNAWFRIMGFRTLRHTGTADHLHVSLSIPENPRAL